MTIKELKQREKFDNKNLNKAYSEFRKLLDDLKKRELPEHIVLFINETVEEVNALPDSLKELRKHLFRKQSAILSLLEKELKLVAKGHYRNLWMSLGIALGVPFGVAFGFALDNMAFIGIGLPIGLAIGLAIGGEMDKKSEKEGRVLDIEIEM